MKRAYGPRIVTARLCRKETRLHPRKQGDRTQDVSHSSCYPTSEVLLAVALARGVPGVMLPAPDQAEAADAMALLRYAALIGK